MTVYWTEFAVHFTVSGAEARWLAETLLAFRARESQLDASSPRGALIHALAEVSSRLEFEVELEEDEAFFYSQRTGHPGQLALLLQGLLRAHRPNECIPLTYSRACSSRINAFTGGAFIVTAESIRELQLADWVKRELPTDKECVGSPSPFATAIAQAACSPPRTLGPQKEE